ncbi:MAG: hypothetical protein WA459_08660 [Stellaceae bacterium]
MRRFNELARKIVNVPREELRQEQNIYDAANAARRAKQRKGKDLTMPERKVEVTLPTGEKGQGTEVQVEESSERWSEFTMADGTVIRAKVTLLSAVRVDGQYDPAGNPLYLSNVQPVITISSVPQELKKKVQ